MCHENNGLNNIPSPQPKAAESKGKTSPCVAGVVFHKLDNAGFIADALQHVLCVFMAYRILILKCWTGLIPPLSYHSDFNKASAIVVHGVCVCVCVCVYACTLRVN